jgi:hypothetical protein
MSNTETQTAQAGWGWNGDMCAVWGEAIVIGESREEKEERARLFAAAPDLLASAMKALNECCDLIGTEAGRALLAAISKAKGISDE